MFSLGQMQKRWNAKRGKNKPDQSSPTPTTVNRLNSAKTATTGLKTTLSAAPPVKRKDALPPKSPTPVTPVRSAAGKPDTMKEKLNKNRYSEQTTLMYNELEKSKRKITSLESRIDTVCAQLEKKDKMFTRLHTAVRSHATLLKSKVEVLTGILAELCSLQGTQGKDLQKKDISTSRVIGLVKDLHRVLRESIVATSTMDDKSDK